MAVATRRSKPNLTRRLGHGLYSPREAAFYARVTTRTLTRWAFGSEAGEAVFRPQFGPGERLLSFLDLVQTLAIREIRAQKKIPLPKFRQAIRYAKKRYGLDYPFARKHVTFWDGENLVLQPRDREFVQASGNGVGQLHFAFVEMYLEDLSFGGDGLADSYTIYRSHHPKPVPVVMKPGIAFGEPLLPSGYTAVCIADAIKIEGSIDAVVDAYMLPKEEVETAYRFIDFLGRSGR